MSRRLLRPSVIVTVVLIALSAVAGWLTASAVQDQEQRLLEERANEVALVLTSSVTSLSNGMTAIGAALRATDESPRAFERAAELSVADTPNASVALVRPTDDGYRIVLAHGPGLRKGDYLKDSAAEAADRATQEDNIVTTNVIGSGKQRFLGWALGAPAAPAGTVLYRQTALGPLSPPRAAGTAPFSELNVALYGSPTPIPAQALVSTAPAEDLPLQAEHVVRKPLQVGSTQWTIEITSNRPLVGGIAAWAGWIVFGVGSLIALLIGAVIESATRRRDSALELYNVEHRVAENLQRGFLPHLPEVAGLAFAARYLAGSSEQQVGGDWYDVFVLPGDEVGIVIGDVLGHDISAAVVMSRIQTALRAYASQGNDPRTVLDLLDRHLTDVQADRLTTVFYGVLSAPDAEGGRTLRFANAGHLQPVVRHADGRVEELTTGRSVLLGAPNVPAGTRTESELRLDEGAVLLLFTDGLVELPDLPLVDSLARLRDTAREAPDGVGPEDLCARLIETSGDQERRDDVAVLAVQLTGVDSPPLADTAAATTQQA